MLADFLSEYSLAEICHFIHEGNKTGMLVLEPELGVQQRLSGTYYLAFQAGRIMYVSHVNDLNKGQSLMEMATQRRWIDPLQVSQIETQLSVLTQPLGTYLKSCNILTTEQLSLLFNAQVTVTSCKLFEIHQGKFRFNPHAKLSYGEMTGLSMPANELALLGLRVLKNWSGLSKKLPAPEVALQRLSPEPQGLRLDIQESQIWQLARGELSLVKIAERLNLSIDKVRQIGFRLVALGLVQEVAAEVAQPTVNKMMDLPKPIVTGSAQAVPVSAKFLGNLMSFLKKKG